MEEEERPHGTGARLACRFGMAAPNLELSVSGEDISVGIRADIALEIEANVFVP